MFRQIAITDQYFKKYKISSKIWLVRQVAANLQLGFKSLFFCKAILALRSPF